MKIHEYQGKELLKQFGVPVPRGIPALSVDEAVAAAEKLGGPVWVVKAQIHAGGRGKGGGVKLARSLDDVRKLASEILGMQLITHQTGPEGQKVRRLYIEDGADIQKEYYVSLVTDRATQKVAFIASSEGGMDIEEVAHSTPEKIITEYIDPLTGLSAEQATKIANAIGLPADSTAQAVDVFQKLYTCYMDTDASLVEINPLNRDSKGNIIALDAKFNFDSNALFRHPEIVAYRDRTKKIPLKSKPASSTGLHPARRQHRLPVNGAGHGHHGHHQAVRRRAGQLPGRRRRRHGREGHGSLQDHAQEQEREGHLVNIFGGIMRCDVIAEGVIAACKAVNLNVPLVVRMKGTNEELGKKMLAESGLPIISADTMAEAATRVVAAVSKYCPTPRPFVASCPQGRFYLGGPAVKVIPRICKCRF